MARAAGTPRHPNTINPIAMVSPTEGKALEEWPAPPGGGVCFWHRTGCGATEETHAHCCCRSDWKLSSVCREGRVAMNAER